VIALAFLFIAGAGLYAWLGGGAPTVRAVAVPQAAQSVAAAVSGKPKPPPHRN